MVFFYYTFMTSKQFDIFLAAFFSDWEKLDGLLESQDDLDLIVSFTGGYLFSYLREFHFSVPEIVQMNIDSWYSVRKSKELTSYPMINPGKFYTESRKCLRNLKMRFPGYPFSAVDYTKNVGLEFDFYKSEGYIEEYIDCEEYYEYLAEGYRELDLDLINCTIKRNVRKVTRLLKKGANPMIDPFDKMVESAMLDSVLADESFHFTHLVQEHVRKLSSGYGSFEIKRSEWMISHLYGSASAAKIYDTVEKFMRKTNYSGKYFG